MAKGKYIVSERVLFRWVLALVVLAPLPLASNRPWSWSLLGGMSGGLLLLWALAVARGRLSAAVPMRRLWLVSLPFCAALVWAWLQAQGWLPLSWWHPLWLEAQQTLAQPVAGGLSLDPSRGMTSLFRLWTYAAVFWLAVQLGRDRQQALLGLSVLTVANAGYAAYGLGVHFLGLESILGLSKHAYLGDLTATFVGRNAYGAYAGLGVLLSLAMFLHAVRRRHSRRRPTSSLEDLSQRVALFLCTASLCGAALLLSHSRGAFLVTALAVPVMLVLAWMVRMVRTGTLLMILPVLMVGGFTLLISQGDVVFDRVLASTEQDARQVLYALSWQAALDAPWIGHGLGSFLPLFRIYQDSGLSSPLVWDFAHNVYLELWSDLGLGGAALLLAAPALAVATCLRGLRMRHRDHVYPLVAVMAALLLGLHGVVDFSLQIPAVAVTFAFLLGVGYAQSWSSRDDAND